MAKDRILSGAGYWMIPAPISYSGKIYSSGLIYEHRYILEQKLGRYLESYETAHHINENKLDNSPENIELINTKEHNSYHMKQKGINITVFKCPSCERIFERQSNRIHGKKFTACSPSCRGKFSRKIQLEGSIKNLDIKIKENVIREYKKYPEKIFLIQKNESVNKKSLEELGLNVTENYSLHSKIPARRKEMVSVFCLQCGKSFLVAKHKNKIFKYCSMQCKNLSGRKCIRPSEEELKKLIETMSMCAIGRIYGVSSNAVKKWI